MGTCTAKVTVTITDQDGVVLERFRVVGEGPDEQGAKGAEVAIGRDVRDYVELQYETEDLPIIGPFERPSPVAAQHGYVETPGVDHGDEDDEDGYLDDYDF